MSERKKAPLVLRLFIYIIILLIITGVGSIWYWNDLKNPVSSQGSAQDLVVNPNESISSIVADLQDQKLIKSGLLSQLSLKLLLKESGKASKIGPGTYKISPTMSAIEIVSVLEGGPTNTDIKVTFLEGWRDEEYANQLNDKMGISKADFLKVAKPGYMFPDTYQFNPKYTAEEIEGLMEDNFNNKFDSDLQNRIKSNGLTLDQGVILASIVEREARSDQVRTMVASILLKRFRIGMALNADATVQYAKDSQTLKKYGSIEKFWEPVTLDDYNSVVSPYNTYLHAGLPPTAICNPSLSSIKAVANANPATPYLYYYHDSQGNSYYEKTLDQHNADVAKYH